MNPLEIIGNRLRRHIDVEGGADPAAVRRARFVEAATSKPSLRRAWPVMAFATVALMLVVVTSLVRQSSQTYAITFTVGHDGRPGEVETCSARLPGRNCRCTFRTGAR